MKAFYPGTFDPFTVGHLAIVCKILEQYDELVIAVGVNEDKLYAPLFGPKCRVFLIQNALKTFCEEYDYRDLTGRRYSSSEITAIEKLKNPQTVKVMTFGGMQVDAAYRCRADVIVRGERDNKDREAERLLALANQGLCEVRGRHIPTVHIACPEEKYITVSSSSVKKLCARQDYVCAASLLPAGIRRVALCKYLRKDFVRLLQEMGCDENDYAEKAWFCLQMAYSRYGMHNIEALAYRLNYLKIYQEETQKLSPAAYNELAAAIFYCYFNEKDSDEAMKESAGGCLELEYFYGTEGAKRIYNLILAQREAFLVKIPDDALLLHDIMLRPLAVASAYCHLAVSSLQKGEAQLEYYIPHRKEVLEKYLSNKLFRLSCFKPFENAALNNITKELEYWQRCENRLSE